MARRSARCVDCAPACGNPVPTKAERGIPSRIAAWSRAASGCVSSAEIHERFTAGESIDELAADSALERPQIEEAIHFERVGAAA